MSILSPVANTSCPPLPRAEGHESFRKTSKESSLYMSNSGSRRWKKAGVDRPSEAPGPISRMT